MMYEYDGIEAGDPFGESEDSAAWLAAYTKPKHEERVRQYCAAQQLPVFLPTYRSWRRWSDRRVLLDLPLFPSYVFVRVTPQQRNRAQQAPGLLWFVRNQQGPVRVDGDELDAIRRLLDSGLGFDALPATQVGDEVEIVRGALRGCRGRLLLKSANQVVLTVAAIKGQVRVSLPDPCWVRRVRPARQHWQRSPPAAADRQLQARTPPPGPA